MPNNISPCLSFLSFSLSSSEFRLKKEIIKGMKNQNVPCSDEVSKSLKILD